LYRSETNKITQATSHRLADIHHRQAIQAQIKNNHHIWCVAWR